MSIYSLRLIIFGLILGFSLTLMADTLEIPNLDNIPPNNSSEGIARPTRAMTMDEVKNQFGPPLEVYEPVGDPPITRWVYEKFVVHFEHQYVIEAVVKK